MANDFEWGIGGGGGEFIYAGIINVSDGQHRLPSNA